MSESDDYAELEVVKLDDVSLDAHPHSSQFDPSSESNVERPLRINWSHPEAQKLLLGVKHKKLGLKDAAEHIERISGVSVTPTTIQRQSQKLEINSIEEIEEIIDVDSYSPSSRGAGEGCSTEEREYPRFEWSLTQRGSRGLMVFESGDVIRLYRIGGKTADDGNTAIYYRCSQCDRLKFRGQTPIKFVDSEPVNSLTPVHHEKCLPRSVELVIKEQLDRRARNLIKTGVAPKRAYEIIRRGAAENEEMMPDFKRVAKSYYRVRRKSAAHQATRGNTDLDDDDDDDEHVVVD